jgi:hypothetical protein
VGLPLCDVFFSLPFFFQIYFFWSFEPVVPFTWLFARLAQPVSVHLVALEKTLAPDAVGQAPLPCRQKYSLVRQTSAFRPEMLEKDPQPGRLRLLWQTAH